MIQSWSKKQMWIVIVCGWGAIICAWLHSFALIGIFAGLTVIVCLESIKRD